MAIVVANKWWTLVIRGICGILFGILAFIWPGAAIAGLALLFGAFALVNGVFAMTAAIGGAGVDDRWPALMFEGLIGAIAGVFTFLFPGITALVLVTIVAAWAIVSGVLQIISAIRLRKTIRGEWLLALAGIASVAFGVILFIVPLAGAVVLAWWIGAYALVFGVLQIVLGFKLRGWARQDRIRGGGALRAA